MHIFFHGYDYMIFEQLFFIFKPVFPLNIKVIMLIWKKLKNMEKGKEDN
jgi:hypothetical protein